MQLEDAFNEADRHFMMLAFDEVCTMTKTKCTKN